MSERFSRPLRVFLLGLACLGALLAGLAWRERLSDGPGPGPRPAPATGTQAVPAPSIPRTLPEFTLNDPAGRPHSVHEWDGHPLLINFWATWCVPCRREIPLLNRIAAEAAPHGLTVLGVAVDFPAAVTEFLAATPVHYPVLVGEQDGLDAVTAFGVATPVFPFSVFSDGRGRILTVHLGALHEPDLRRTLGVLARLERGELDLAGARAALAAGERP